MDLLLEERPPTEDGQLSFPRHSVMRRGVTARAIDAGRFVAGVSFQNGDLFFVVPDSDRLYRHGRLQSDLHRAFALFDDMPALFARIVALDFDLAHIVTVYRIELGPTYVALRVIKRFDGAATMDALPRDAGEVLPNDESAAVAVKLPEHSSSDAF